MSEKAREILLRMAPNVLKIEGKKPKEIYLDAYTDGYQARSNMDALEATEQNSASSE